MSKNPRTIFLIFAASVQILQLFNNSYGQDIAATIKIEAHTAFSAHVQGRFLNKRPLDRANRISFLTEYAGVFGIDRRISDLRVSDAGGAMSFVRGNPGEYEAVKGINEWSYVVDLTRPTGTAANAHVSWFDNDGGILMLDDLLPQDGGKSAKIKIELPPGWKLFSTEKAVGANEFEIANIEKTAFFVSQNWRVKDVASSGSSTELLLSGEWLFTDDEAAKFAAEIFAAYEKLFGSAPKRSSQIAILKFPAKVSAGNWEADTRGSSIVIASSDMPFKSQSLQALHEQLRHEIFHLWVPNGLNFTGHYDWFYEGFALYQSLKAGVAVNRIRFEDMLDTLSRAYAYDRETTMMSKPEPRSLIDLSKSRWIGSANSRIYARGMLVAFLCDLAMLDESKGKRSTADLLREIYSPKAGADQPRDGNDAILSIIRSHRVLVPIAERYISGAEIIEWSTLLNAAGLEAVSTGGITNLAVMRKPSGRQKDLLDKLGYNNWRKLSQSLK